MWRCLWIAAAMNRRASSIRKSIFNAGRIGYETVVDFQRRCLSRLAHQFVPSGRYSAAAEVVSPSHGCSMIRRTESIILAFLEKHGEASKHQLAEVSSRSIDNIHKRIARMKEQRKVYITKYIQSGQHAWQVAPVYALGRLEDAKPPAKTNCAKSTLQQPDGLTEYRTCRVCGTSLPLTNKYFPYQNKPLMLLSNRCKTCLREDNVRRREMGIPKQTAVFETIPGSIVRKQTNHGTTLVRFGDQWRPSRVEPRRLPAMAGYSSGFEK
jgi:hypothetical protein